MAAKEREKEEMCDSRIWQLFRGLTAELQERVLATARLSWALEIFLIFQKQTPKEEPRVKNVAALCLLVITIKNKTVLVSI